MANELAAPPLAAPPVDGVRVVTNDEVAFYQQNGWVVLRELVCADVAERLLDASREFVDRHTAEGATLDPGRRSTKTSIAPAMAALPDPGPEDELLWTFSHSPAIAAAHERFLDWPGPVRFFRNEVYLKPPEGTGGVATPWHQDFPSLPLDRSDRPKIWLALANTPATCGTVRYASGSHHAGVMGRHFKLASTDLFLERFPSFFEKYPMSPPIDLGPGDATVHHVLTVHSAGANTSAENRLAFSTSYIAADSLYTAAQPWYFAHPVPGLTVNQPLDLPQFPVIGGK